jgi:cyclomaltodextrinase
MSVPAWVQDSVFYQIFPDRFANGNPANDPPNVQPWGSPPTNWGFQGGDLQGIIQRFDYLLDLGVNAIYLNPIFQATSNHRYNTTDYYKIDPKLGDMDDFHALLDLAHRNGVRLILDGVFNHCGRGFFAFSDVLENNQNSPYRDWYHISHFPVDAFSPGEAHDYKAWWGIKSLPKFNTSNPQARKYLLDVARYWIEQGADGWRLDVPNEIDDDIFWDDFRYSVKSANSEAYLLGEIWTADPRWCGEDHFDGLMSYPFRECLLALLAGDGQLSTHCLASLESLTNIYPRQHVNAMFVPLSTHDTERALTRLHGDEARLRLAWLCQFAYPGAPSIYYGDEIGMAGGKDPDCRRAFPWDESQWKQGLRDYVKKLVAVRKSTPALRRGVYRHLASASRAGSLAFTRLYGEESILVALNTGSAPSRLSVPVAELGWQDGRTLHSLLDHGEFTVSGGVLALDLPPLSGFWIG